MPSTPPISKLFNLKQWLTLDDTAKHLSIVFGEEVTRADVLRLALDKRLTLSVDFVNHADARKGRLVPLEACPMMICTRSEAALSNRIPLIHKTNILQTDIPNLEKEIRDGLASGDLFLTSQAIYYQPPDKFLLLEEEVRSISGVWDLPLLGAEALDVEHMYQMETGGPEITLTNLEGVFVERDNIVCQLQEDWEDNEYVAGSKARGKKVEDRIARAKVSKAEADKLRMEYKEQRKQFLEKRKSQTPEDKCYPAGKLRTDAVYVVRTSTLREFEQSVLNIDNVVEKATTPREETTLLNIIGGLVGLLLGNTPAGKAQSVFNSQSSVIDALLAAHEGKPGISTRTLQEKLAAAKRSLKS